MWFLLWLIPLALLGLLLLCLLTAPIRLRVDTERGHFDAGIVGLFRFWLDTRGEMWRFRLRVLFIPVPLKWGKRKKQPRKPKRKKKRRRGSAGLAMRYGRAVFSSFRIKRCRLELDTEDYALNAQLYPLGVLLARWGIDLDVNFEGRNELVLVVQNRGYRILYRVIRTALRNRREKKNFDSYTFTSNKEQQNGDELSTNAGQGH